MHGQTWCKVCDLSAPPDVISMLCRSSSSLLIFSSSSLWTVSKSSSFSLCMQTRTKAETWCQRKTIHHASHERNTQLNSDLPMLASCLGLTLVLVLDWLQTQLSVDTWQRQGRDKQTKKREWRGVARACERLRVRVEALGLPATLVRTCMFSSSTARGSKYSAARPASTSASLLFTWLRRSRYSLDSNAALITATAKGKVDINQFHPYWSLRSVNCFSRLDISSRHSILLRSQSSSSISGTW